jgi:hypothetical protein
MSSRGFRCFQMSQDAVILRVSDTQTNRPFCCFRAGIGIDRMPVRIRLKAYDETAARMRYFLLHVMRQQ